MAAGHGTLAGFAAALGTSRTNVSRWEHGRVTPGMEWLSRIAAECNCTVDWLLTGREPTTPPPSGDS